MVKKIIYIIISISVLLLSACSKDIPKDEQDKLKVYTSFYVMNDFAEKIGGDKISITNLVPAGTEPHDWEPTAKDIVDLQQADVFIYNGAGMETYIGKILASIENDKLVVIEASKGIALQKIEENDTEDINIQKEDKDEEESHDEDLYQEEIHSAEGNEHYHDIDPHVWLNPLLAKVEMKNIADGLTKADKENAEFYKNNYESYAAELDKLDMEFREELKGFENRSIVVTHKAYGYLCEEYSLNQISIEGLNADAEPTPLKMAEITRFAKDKNIKVIFIESLVSPKLADTIAREIGAKTMILNPLGGLKQEEIEAGKDYFSIMRENLQAIKTALMQ